LFLRFDVPTVAADGLEVVIERSPFGRCVTSAVRGSVLCRATAARGRSAWGPAQSDRMATGRWRLQRAPFL